MINKDKKGGLNVCSFNARGLENFRKRRDVFHYLINKKILNYMPPGHPLYGRTRTTYENRMGI